MSEKQGRIFILDDDKIFLALYQDLLENQGYEVFGTDNAYKFLLYGRELIPDIILLDVNMPQTNGWEVLQKIAGDDILQNTPVIMLTVCQDNELAYASDVAHFLYKPLSLEMMADILNSYCRGGQDHDILLLEDYEPLFAQLKDIVQKKKFRCFGVHNFRSAKKYLQKNNPKKICVCYSPENFLKIKDELPKDKTVRIEGVSDIEGLIKDIK